MENIYTKFYGSDNYFQKKGPNNDAFYLSRSESVPSLSTNYHSKFPYNLPGQCLIEKMKMKLIELQNQT